MAIANMSVLSVFASNDAAFSYGLNHAVGTKIDGGELDMWWRATICYRKIDGRTSNPERPA
jgi:ketosteroid isomerase-like protein